MLKSPNKSNKKVTEKSLNYSYNNCDIHKNNIANFFCITDNKFVCDYCLLYDDMHKGHSNLNKFNINNYYNKVKEELTQKIGKIDSLVNLYKVNDKNFYNAFSEKKKKIINKINLFYKNLQAEILTDKKNKLNDIEKYFSIFEELNNNNNAHISELIKSHSQDISDNTEDIKKLLYHNYANNEIMNQFDIFISNTRTLLKKKSEFYLELLNNFYVETNNIDTKDCVHFNNIDYKDLFKEFEYNLETINENNSILHSKIVNIDNFDNNNIINNNIIIHKSCVINKIENNNITLFDLNSINTDDNVNFNETITINDDKENELSNSKKKLSKIVNSPYKKPENNNFLKNKKYINNTYNCKNSLNNDFNTLKSSSFIKSNMNKDNIEKYNNIRKSYIIDNINFDVSKIDLTDSDIKYLINYYNLEISETINLTKNVEITDEGLNMILNLLTSNRNFKINNIIVDFCYKIDIFKIKPKEKLKNLLTISIKSVISKYNNHLLKSKISELKSQNINLIIK